MHGKNECIIMLKGCVNRNLLLLGGIDVGGRGRGRDRGKRQGQRQEQGQ